MNPPAGPTPSSSRRRWLLLGLAGVAVLALVAVSVVGAYRWNDPTIPPTATRQNLASLPSPGPICQVEVTGQGWSVDRRKGQLRYAVILRNPCPDGAYGVSVRVRLRPAPPASADLAGSGTNVERVQTLAPGAETAVAGSFVGADDPDRSWLDSVTGISVRVLDAGWIPLDQIAAAGTRYAMLDAPLHTRATIRHLRVIEREKGTDGYLPTARIGYQLHLDHRLDERNQGVVLVFRDRQGRVLGGDVDPGVRADLPVCETYDEHCLHEVFAGRRALPDRVELPPGTDLSRLQAYWQPRVAA
ncbi:hypothetical protein [Actinocatenispora thailandica]|uniref:hypothetical protein n=1 Tax=Actinocatenispora thailandica TaxID=227318 RepID=UPI0031DFD7DB